jgi:hypothetical protein
VKSPKIFDVEAVQFRAIRMSPVFPRLIQAVAVCAIVLVVAAGRAAPPEPGATASEASPPRQGGPTTEGVEFFETHIRPVLAEKCYECHSADSKVLQGGLRLDTAERMRAGGDSGPAVVPQMPGESLLLSALRYETYEMPPSGKLPDDVIANFEKWIALGAPDPRGETTTPVVPPDAHAEATANSRRHWAFRKPERVSPPLDTDESAVRSDLDRFVLARLETAKLTPSPQASPRVLLRRLYYDLIGLPPTFAELNEFAADPTDARYEATVDRLLASPRFGERWARHWLDVARYADTKGYVFQEDRGYKHAYTYRDWVIASFNSDRPFDRFIVAQIAGDQIDDPSCAPASGFLTLGRRFLKNQQEIINDRIDVLTRGVLGLTVGCARCHDHKYDPISAADYYAMYGVFASSEEKDREDGPPSLTDAATPYDPYVFLRGNAGSRGPNVDRRFLTILTADGNPKPFKKGSGRLEMAEAIASRDNPLTARVWANRVWGHLFGAPIVATPSDFGVRGTPPTHPKLLDWLACELMTPADGYPGWSTKRLIRRIVLSNTYRQASNARPDCLAVDADNQLLWRANPRRLDLESFRDTVVAVAGRLDETMGGPSVSLTDAPFSTRRAVYGFIERQNLPAFFRTFDFANPNTHTPERPLTTSPQQALFLMNSPFVIEQSIHLAARSATEGVAGVEPQANRQQSQDSSAAANRVRRINRLYEFALGREANAEELAEALEFVDRGEPPRAAKIANQLAWQCGWGTVDEVSGKVQFQGMPRFTGSAWQGGPKLPDPTLGWSMLHATGGHPGDAAHQAIRRWIAPEAGTLNIEGVLSHASEHGDGVRGRVVSSRAGVAGAWDAFHGDVATAPSQIAVEAGDTIDFVTDCRTSIEYDDFNWTVTLRLTPSNGEPLQLWDSAGGFHGPVLLPLSRWEQLAQALLMSNEFMFVD